MSSTQNYAEVVRPYGGAEGKRVRVGERFFVKRGAIKQPKDCDLVEITHARFAQLLSAKIVIPAEDAGDCARKTKTDKVRQTPKTKTPGAKVEPDSRPPADSPRRAARTQSPKPESRAGAANRAAQARQADGPTGAAVSRSSSPADPQTGASTLRQRGTRRGQTSGGQTSGGQTSAGSPSTTPPASSPGETPSTAATPGGGGNTQNSEDSGAFA